MLFVTEKIPVVLVALGTALSLYFTGILNLGQALGGLGDASTIFIASLFVVSAGLEITGVTAWAGQLLIAKSGESRVRQLVLIMLLVFAADGPDQSQRRGCRAAAGRRRHGRAVEALAIAAPDAAWCLRRMPGRSSR